MLKLFWHCLDDNTEDRQFISESLNELEKLLKKPIVQVEFKAYQLSKALARIANEILHCPSKESSGPLFDCWFRMIQKNPKDKFSPLLIYCRPDSEIAEAIRKKDYIAQWGYTQNGCISAVYEPNNKYILWHEALHLFDAGDCYCYANPNAGTTCGLTNCLMQYAPTQDSVGEWPFLCKKNIEILQKRMTRQSTPTVGGG